MIAFTTIVFCTYTAALQMTADQLVLNDQADEYFADWQHVKFVGMEDIAEPKTLKYYQDARFIARLPEINGERPSFLNRMGDLTDLLIQMSKSKISMEKRLSLLLAVNRITGTWTEQFRLIGKNLGADNEQDLLTFALSRAIPQAPALDQHIRAMQQYISDHQFTDIKWKSITLPKNLDPSYTDPTTLYDIFESRTFWLQGGLDLLNRNRRIQMMRAFRQRIAQKAFELGATNNQIAVACAHENWAMELLKLHIYRQWARITSRKNKDQFLQFLHTPTTLDGEERAALWLQQHFDGASVCFFGPALLVRNSHHAVMFTSIVNTALAHVQHNQALNDVSQLKAIVLAVWEIARPDASKYLYGRDLMQLGAICFRKWIQVTLLLRDPTDARAKDLLKNMLHLHTGIAYGSTETRVWKADDLLAALRTAPQA